MISGRNQALRAWEADLHRLQEAFAGVAGDALIGQQIEVPVAGLDERKPHRFSTFDAGQFDGGLRPRACRRRSG